MKNKNIANAVICIVFAITTTAYGQKGIPEAAKKMQPAPENKVLHYNTNKTENAGIQSPLQDNTGKGLLIKVTNEKNVLQGTKTFRTAPQLLKQNFWMLESPLNEKLQLAVDAPSEVSLKIVDSKTWSLMMRDSSSAKGANAEYKLFDETSTGLAYTWRRSDNPIGSVIYKGLSIYQKPINKDGLKNAFTSVKVFVSLDGKDTEIQVGKMMLITYREKTYQILVDISEYQVTEEGDTPTGYIARWLAVLK